MSTHSVYKPVEDPLHVFAETDPLGDVNSSMSPPYSMSKIAQEAVARTCARQFDLPVTIARMNASYGPNGGLPAYHADAIRAGQTVTTRWDPCPYSPIHQDDINTQTEALLGGGISAGDHRQLGGRRGGFRTRMDRLPGRAVRSPGAAGGRIDSGHAARLDRRRLTAQLHHGAVQGGLARGPAPNLGEPEHEVASPQTGKSAFARPPSDRQSSEAHRGARSAHRSSALILLILGLAVKALKWLIIIAVVVWMVGAVRGFLARRSSSRI